VPGPGDLHDLAEVILEETVAALDTIPDYEPDLLGSPERAYVSPGVPVADFVGEDCCSQVAVWVSPTSEMDTFAGGNDAGRRSARFAWKNVVGFSIAIMRCIPTGGENNMGLYAPPSASSLTESSRQHNADHWAVWNHMHNAVNAERILSHCDNVVIEGITASIPSGGCAGWVLTLRASLDGYDDIPGS